MPRLLSRIVVIVFAVVILAQYAIAQEHLPPAQKKFDESIEAWGKVVEKIAPAKPIAKVKEPRKVLVFSLFTGFNHKVIPFADKAIEILGDKSGAFETTVTRDIEMLTPESLKKFDVLVLNNNCSRGGRRNLFLDDLEKNPKYKDLTTEQREARAKELEKSVLDFIAGGKGLVVLHGAIVMQNNSPEFTGMIGGAFWYHPPTQEVTLNAVDPDHPLVAAFKGKTPFVHTDEPYCFKGAYDKANFRPLLSMDTSKLTRSGEAIVGRRCYVSWIKPHGKGRVFYCSPSHYQESYESSTMLRFLLDGIQYTAGDLKCDDSPTGVSIEIEKK